MGIVDRALTQLAKWQVRYGTAIMLFFLVFTLVTVYGVTKIEFSGDINEEMPRHLPVYKLTDKITDTFSGQDMMFILLELDDSIESKGTPNDIRDRKIVEYIVDLHKSLETEPSIIRVISVAPVIESLQTLAEDKILSQDSIDYALSSTPGINQIINKDYSITMIMVYVDTGSSQDKVIKMTNLISNKLDAMSKPSGVKITITGTPNLISTILDLLKSDAIYTLLLASVIVFMLLVAMQKSITRGALIFLPILLGIIWTLGTMGLTGIKINVATAGLGAMILGLGVEYGVFMLERYHEERDKGKSQQDSLIVSVPAVGTAVFGSGTTTIVGFLALTLSIMPMLQHLGISLALGIAYSIIAALVVEPIIIILEEDFEHWHVTNKHKKYSSKKNRLVRREK